MRSCEPGVFPRSMRHQPGGLAFDAGKSAVSNILSVLFQATDALSDRTMMRETVSIYFPSGNFRRCAQRQAGRCSTYLRAASRGLP